MSAATTKPQARQADAMTDWTGADFDSFEVLVLCRVPNPITRVARARRVERAENRSAR